MIQRIVCILIVVLLQMAATSCSATKQSAHTVCPEPTMTLSDDNADRHCDSAPSASDLMTHQKAGLTLPATETFAAHRHAQTIGNGNALCVATRGCAFLQATAVMPSAATCCHKPSASTPSLRAMSLSYATSSFSGFIIFLQIKARHGFSQTPRHNTIVKLKNKESWNQNLKSYHIRTATT